MIKSRHLSAFLDALSGRGFVAAGENGAAEWAVKFRDAYTGDADDRRDVLVLCGRFELPVPSQYRC